MRWVLELAFLELWSFWIRVRGMSINPAVWFLFTIMTAVYGYVQQLT
jgi:hypothetical protein